MKEDLTEAKQFYTQLAKQKATQNGHCKQMYWTEGDETRPKRGASEYFVEAWKSGEVVYSKA